MRIEEFDYELPEDLIATAPTEPRDHCRLLVVNRKTGEIAHREFHQIADFLNPGDLLVLNNSKVIRARLKGTDASGREYEIFLLTPLSNHLTWTCLVRPGKKIKPSKTLRFPDGMEALVSKTGPEDFQVEFPNLGPEHFHSWLEKAGDVPLPPYIKRPADARDTYDYQTIYAREPGSVAAPTAGLHFTDPLLQNLEDRGIERVEVTLHVGYGTFSPIRVQQIEDHQMHKEAYRISAKTANTIRKARETNKRIIAVGTTSLRTLESMPTMGCEAETSLFIWPGYQFSQCDGLITNFHLPKSSLYVLVAAFLGLDTTRKCYQEAIKSGYRFYSYGDAMLIY